MSSPVVWWGAIALAAGMVFSAAAFIGCTVNVEVHVDIEGGACLDVPQLGKAKCPQPEDDAGAEAGN